MYSYPSVCLLTIPIYRLGHCVHLVTLIIMLRYSAMFPKVHRNWVLSSYSIYSRARH